MGILKRDKSIIYGLSDDLQTLIDAINQAALDRAAADGDLQLLETTNTTDLVSAINSLLAGAESGSDASLKIDQNLADLQDVATARTNLSIYSIDEINNAIEAAKLDLGTNVVVATIAERDALMDLNTNDRVFVADSGDGTWATYKPTTFDAGTGAVTGWAPLMTQYSLEATISASALKTEYESNADTNAYTDAAKAKVDLLSVTQAIDLDDVALKAELGQDLLSIGADATQVPSADAVTPYIRESVRLGGTTTLKETLTVTVSDTITLTYAPKGGVAGIMNFGTVRYTDINGVSYDAPLQSTATPNVFTLVLETSGEWDGFDVTIQYAHVPPSGPVVDEQGYADQGTLD